MEKIKNAKKTEINKKEIQELKKDLEDYAKESGLRLNPNRKITFAIIKGFLKNKKEKGELYCPCRIPSGKKEEDEKIICPCVFSLVEIREKGKCHCGLFVR